MYKTETKSLALRAGMVANLTPNEIAEFKRNPQESFRKFVSEEKIVFEGDSYFPAEDDRNEPINGQNEEFEFYLQPNLIRRRFR